MIQALRFVERDGKRILQYATDAEIKDGETVWRWKDVLFVPGEAPDAGL